MNDVLEYLKQLDLSDIEAKLYLTLLKRGSLSVRELAETIEIKRTTAYFYIDQLIEKGLIIKIVKGSKKMVAANDPHILKGLLDKKAASVKTAQEKFPEILTRLTKDIPGEHEIKKAEIRYFKGKAGIMKIYEEALQGDELRLYVNLKELDRVMMPNTLGFGYMMFENALERNPQLKIYEIVADTPGSVDQYQLEETAKTQRYFFRHMPHHVGLTSPGILLFDNKVAIVNCQEKAEIVVLHNVDYFVNSKKLFDFIWNVLPGSTKSL